MSTIVVGIDSSEGARRALEWALEEAALREAEVELVHAFPTPEIAALPTVMTFPSNDELHAYAEQVVEEALEAVGGSGEVPVITTVRSGGAANILCEAAADADLLVVGARGLGGFRGLLLGSVTHQVVTHSPCPVVVVMPDTR